MSDKNKSIYDVFDYDLLYNLIRYRKIILSNPFENETEWFVDRYIPKVYICFSAFFLEFILKEYKILPKDKYREKEIIDEMSKYGFNEIIIREYIGFRELRNAIVHNNFNAKGRIEKIENAGFKYLTNDEFKVKIEDLITCKKIFSEIIDIIENKVSENEFHKLAKEQTKVLFEEDFFKYIKYAHLKIYSRKDILRLHKISIKNGIEKMKNSIPLSEKEINDILISFNELMSTIVDKIPNFYDLEYFIELSSKIEKVDRVDSSSIILNDSFHINIHKNGGLNKEFSVLFKNINSISPEEINYFFQTIDYLYEIKSIIKIEDLCNLFYLLYLNYKNNNNHNLFIELFLIFSNISKIIYFWRVNKEKKSEIFYDRNIYEMIFKI